MLHTVNQTDAPSTFCRICEVACGLHVETDRTGYPVRLRPDRTHPVSRGFACAKGTRFVETMRHPERLLYPLGRQTNGQYTRLSWEAAMALTAERLTPLIARYGPHAIGLYIGNPIAFHTMGAISMLAFMRGLGSRNVFTAGSQDCNNKFTGAQIVHGSPLIHPIPDFEHTDFALMLGTNPAVSQASFVHLAGGSTVFDRLMARGAHVVWVDPRRTESAQRWGEHLPIRPGRDIYLLLALLYELRDLYRADETVEGLDGLLALAAGYAPERVSVPTGIPAERIRGLAQTIRRARRATFHMSVGVNQGGFGTLSYVALQALAFLSGNCDRRGGLLFHPLATFLAALGHRYGLGAGTPGSRIGAFPSVLQSLPGGVLADEIMTAGEERIRALIVMGGDPLTSIPGGPRLRQAFNHLDFLVCLDLFQNATGRVADLLLPTTSWLERWDVATTTMLFQQSPLIQFAGPVAAPPGEVRSEAHILADMSLAIGRPLWGARSVARLWRNVPWDAVLTACSRVLGVFTWLRYGRVAGLLTPRPRPGRYRGRGPCTPGHRMRFWHAGLEAEAERLASDYRAIEDRVETSSRGMFTLVGRRRRLGQNSWLHRGVYAGEASEKAWFAPADLVALGLPDGGEVELRTEQATIRMLAMPETSVLRGLVVVPHGLPGANVNDLIPSGPAQLEPLSGQHRMTGIAVEVQVVAGAPP